MSGRRLAAALTLLALLAAAPANAYHREEHYYTVQLTLAELRPRIEGDAVAAMCSQLADESKELNAIEAYRALMRHPLAYAAWSFGGGASETVARMLAIQQLVHGLTGGSPRGTRAVAERAVAAATKRLDGKLSAQERADALCALGFSLHLYGDTYAHTRLKNPDKMYDTGLGHFFDASVPDFPLCAPHRQADWAAYVAASPKLFPGHRVDGSMAALVERSRALLGTSKRANAFEQGKLRRAETDALDALGETPMPLYKNRREKPCREVVAAWAALHHIQTPPTCDGTWRLFSRDAAEAYADYEATPANETEPARALKMRRPFTTESPFQEAR